MRTIDQICDLCGGAAWYRAARVNALFGHGRICDHIGPDGGDITKNAVDVGVPK